MLPASNSLAARQMRVVAALTVTGRALVTHIFRQMLVAPDSDLYDALGRLALENAEHESYVRAVLLKILPGDQIAIQEAGVDDAVVEIVEALHPWLPNQGQFASELRPLCEEASKAWNLVLTVQNKIEPNLDPQVLRDWRPLPPILKDAAVKPNTASNKPQAKPAKQQQTATSAQSGMKALNMNHVAGIVWPIFLAHPIDGADVEMISCGYVLTKAQMQEAVEEVSREESTYRTARNARQTVRRQSITQKKRPNSLGFTQGQGSFGSSIS